MVFPDGACRPGDGCQEGTFYSDSPAATPRMETFFRDDRRTPVTARA